MERSVTHSQQQEINLSGERRQPMEGLIYLLNQAGIALAQANAEIGELRTRLSEIESREQDLNA
jgi:hypothetical protein